MSTNNHRTQKLGILLTIIASVAGPASGQSFSIVSADGRTPPFPSDGTVRLEMWFQNFGLLNSWQVDLELGDAVTVAPGLPVSIGGFGSGATVVVAGLPFGWGAAPSGLFSTTIPRTRSPP